VLAAITSKRWLGSLVVVENMVAAVSGVVSPRKSAFCKAEASAEEMKKKRAKANPAKH